MDLLQVICPSGIIEPSLVQEPISHIWHHRGSLKNQMEPLNLTLKRLLLQLGKTRAWGVVKYVKQKSHVVVLYVYCAFEFVCFMRRDEVKETRGNSVFDNK